MFSAAIYLLAAYGLVHIEQAFHPFFIALYCKLRGTQYPLSALEAENNLLKLENDKLNKELDVHKKTQQETVDTIMERLTKR